MDGVDGSSHYSERRSTDKAPSLLTIVIDANPHAWALLQSSLPLSKAVSNLLVFINAHLAFNNANQVAIVASHSHRALWLYPKPPKPTSDVDGDVEMGNTSQTKNGTASSNANKYRPYAIIEHDLLASLRDLISSTTEKDVSSTSTTQISGALTLALSYINKASLVYSEASGASASVEPTDAPAETTSGLNSRILVLSVSGDLAHQYIPIMNATFAAQRLKIHIDILKLAGDTVFLQQASDATGGIYMQVKNTQGLLQYLMMAFLPDHSIRQHLVMPSQEVVDFRAACFCHRKVVDVGYVCSICLSIFCAPPEGNICLTCGTQLGLGDYGLKPAVIPKKKRKKKRIAGSVGTGSTPGTPAPGE